LEITGKLIAPEQKSVRAKLVRNVVFSALRSVLLWPIPFLLIPYILNKIGTGGYGTWAVFLTLIGLTGLADLGLGGTLTKQVAEHHANGDSNALDRLINSALMIYAFVGLVLIAVLLLGAGRFLPLLFQGSQSSHQELVSLWHWVLLIIGLNILIMPLYSVVTGLQRMDLTAIASAISTLIIAALTLIFLSLGWGLRGLVMANLWAGILNLGVFAWMVRRLLPETAFRPLRFQWSEVREILGFGLQLYVMQMTVVIQNQLEKLYLARFTGVVPVGWYNIASDVGLKVRRVPELLLAPVIGAASELDARGDDRRLEELYHRLHKYLAFISIPLTCYVVAVAPRFVDLWLGPQLHVIAVPLAVLVWVNFLNLTTGPGVLILIGKGLLKPGLNATLVGLGLIVTLSFVLIYKFGFSGAVVGILVAVIVATALFFYWFYRTTHYSWKRVLAEAYWKPAVCSISLLGIFRLAVHPDHLGWVGLSLQTVLFGALYFVALLMMRFFDHLDVAQIETFLPIARVARRIVPVA
jgi:O-antigen/teichoic acid export membrane protein